jgi:tagatose-6-phosphate ketose/aldose isomerase
MLQQLSEEKSKELGSYHTQKEITQQPQLWKKTYEYMLGEKDNIQSFFQAMTDRHETVKVILTGAGTSAFLGECIAPYLSESCDHKQYIFQPIATTDIVSNPTQYLDPDTPTIMVSFARSGNSPESLASIELGEQLIDPFYQINITCNKEGNLATRSRNLEDALLLCLPEESNDKGFAMTSSFTCMMLSAILTFQHEQMKQFDSNIKDMSNRANGIMSDELNRIQKIAALPFSNLVYLGSGAFAGLAREAALKMLELSGGKVFTSHDSSLGFRHGPKSLLNDQSLVVMMLSNDDYTRKYDLDMLKELYEEKQRTSLKLVAISDDYIREADDHCDDYFCYGGNQGDLNKLEDVWALFPSIVYAQILAFYKSVNLGIRPDNPSPDGSVNRVVKGVTIYPFSESK